MPEATPYGFRQRACPVCGADGKASIFAESNYDSSQVTSFSFSSRKLPELMHYRLLRCLVCDALYANPAPDLGTLARAYGEADFDSGEESGYAARTYARLLPRLGIKDKAGALDIGTGDGAFLRCLLDAGFTEVQGVEPSLAPIKAAPPSIRGLIRYGLFNSADYQPNSLSLVTCFQTMEHLDQPRAVCEASYRLLKPGGAFYTVCHDYCSLSAKILRRRSPIFDIEHLQLFSQKSLKHLLESQGFDHVQVFPISNRYPLQYWMKIFPVPAPLKRSMIAAVKALGAGVVPVALRAGNVAGFGIR
jgi:SAM-dependent methyltransferase